MARVVHTQTSNLIWNCAGEMRMRGGVHFYKSFTKRKLENRIKNWDVFSVCCIKSKNASSWNYWEVLFSISCTTRRNILSLFCPRNEIKIRKLPKMFTSMKKDPKRLDVSEHSAMYLISIPERYPAWNCFKNFLNLKINKWFSLIMFIEHGVQTFFSIVFIWKSYELRVLWGISNIKQWFSRMNMQQKKERKEKWERERKWTKKI